MVETATAEPISSDTLAKILREIKKKADPERIEFISLETVKKIQKETEAAGKPFGLAFAKRSISSTVYFGVYISDPTQISGLDAPQLFFAMKPNDYVVLHEEQKRYPPTDPELENAPGVSVRVKKIIKTARKTAENAIVAINKAESHPEDQKAPKAADVERLVADEVAKVLATMNPGRRPKPKFKPKKKVK